MLFIIQSIIYIIIIIEYRTGKTVTPSCILYGTISATEITENTANIFTYFNSSSVTETNVDCSTCSSNPDCLQIYPGKCVISKETYDIIPGIEMMNYSLKHSIISFFIYIFSLFSLIFIFLIIGIWFICFYRSSNW